MAFETVIKGLGSRVLGYQFSINKSGTVCFSAELMAKMEKPKFITFRVDLVEKKVGIIIAQGHELNVYSICQRDKGALHGRCTAKPLAIKIGCVDKNMYVNDIEFDKGTDMWVGTYKEEEEKDEAL